MLERVQALEETVLKNIKTEKNKREREGGRERERGTHINRNVEQKKDEPKTTDEATAKSNQKKTTEAQPEGETTEAYLTALSGL